jgi:hypothetical protein
MRTEYPAKILVAWVEAIGGNIGLRDWLLRNGYPELGVFTAALRNKQEARDWLMQHGHAHLMAVIRGIEGDPKALEWLQHHGFGVLRQVALAGDGDEDAFRWLITNGHRELAMAAHRMNRVKTSIDEDHHDPHKYHLD